MLRSLYSAASGMLVQMLHQQVIGDNLANVNTVGFKKDVLQEREWNEVQIPGQFSSVLDSMLSLGSSGAAVQVGGQAPPIGYVGGGVLTDPVVPDLSQGEVHQTGKPFDVALNGPGFLAIQGTNNQVWYTRAGSLSRSPDGTLTTTDGRAILGQDGQPVHIPLGALTVTGDGTLFVDGQPINRMMIVDVPPTAGLTKQGASTLVPQRTDVATAPSQTTVVQQGALEYANVDLTNTMVDSMAVMRNYEANQRMVQLEDQIMNQTVNDVGRV